MYSPALKRSYGHIETDAQTFADWNVDYLKFDGCNIDLNLLPIGYAQMAQALNKTGRPIVYSCSWPAYLVNQPEKIVVGDPRLTPDQSRAQMTMWSIWSAPLIMSNDLRNIDPIYKEILLNKRVIAVDQDPLGIMGRLVKKSGSTSIYVKKMTPCDENRETCSYAVAILNRSKRDLVTETFTLTELGLIHHSGYNILELWDGKNMGTFKSEGTYSAKVPPTGVHFFKATPKIFEENAEKVDDFEGKEINEDRDLEKSM
uniref:Alpha-galactosidase n=1 Tax=Acrobeloides nanus TaxID=290746 RepID=A0A914BY81_9BILA